MDLQIQQLTDTSTIPKRATTGSIGYDLYYDGPDTSLDSGNHAMFSTGIALKCPAGTYARISPRSGLTIKNNITTLAGVIDPDYRGDIKVILHNFGKTIQHIKRNQKIAQLILEKAAIPETTPVETLNNT
jgi:dUTP pyrophosphatase